MKATKLYYVRAVPPGVFELCHADGCRNPASHVAEKAYDPVETMGYYCLHHVEAYRALLNVDADGTEPAPRKPYGGK